MPAARGRQGKKVATTLLRRSDRGAPARRPPARSTHRRGRFGVAPDRPSTGQPLSTRTCLRSSAPCSDPIRHRPTCPANSKVRLNASRVGRAIGRSLTGSSGQDHHRGLAPEISRAGPAGQPKRWHPPPSSSASLVRWRGCKCGCAHRRRAGPMVPADQSWSARDHTGSGAAEQCWQTRATCAALQTARPHCRHRLRRPQTPAEPLTKTAKPSGNRWKYGAGRAAWPWLASAGAITVLNPSSPIDSAKSLDLAQSPMR